MINEIFEVYDTSKNTTNNVKVPSNNSIDSSKIIEEEK